MIRGTARMCKEMGGYEFALLCCNSFTKSVMETHFFTLMEELTEVCCRVIPIRLS